MMFKKLFAAGTVLFFSSFTLADNLALEIKAKDISITGTFGFNPGSTLKISGSDIAGKPYDIEVISKIQKDDIIQFICKLNHDGKYQSASAVTKKGRMASITSGTKGQSPDLKLEVNWTE